MKYKLRELAEMVREAYRAGFIAACKWPEPVSQDVDSSAYIKEFNDWSFSVSEKHAAILDAEGDGGALGEFVGVLHVVADQASQYGVSASFGYSDNCGGLAVGDHDCYTHPARSGVVSDEDVEDVCVQFYKDAWKSFHQHEREQFRKEMRAALEHFAKGERHDP